MRVCLFFFVKQNTAYEMRISDWSSDVCSSDLPESCQGARVEGRPRLPARACRWHGGPQLWRCRRQAGGPAAAGQLGRASCRERVCQYVSLPVVAVALQKTTSYHSLTSTIARRKCNYESLLKVLQHI